MSAPAPELHPIVWPEPSPLQHWWTHVMGATTPTPGSSRNTGTSHTRHPSISSDAHPARH